MSRENGFDKDPQRAIEGGRKSKRGRSIKTIIRDILEAPIEGLEEVIDPANMPKKFKGMTVEDAIWVKTAMQAVEGDKDARRDISDRLEGKATQKVEQEISEKTPKKIEFSFVDVDKKEESGDNKEKN